MRSRLLLALLAFIVSVPALALDPGSRLPPQRLPPVRGDATIEGGVNAGGAISTPGKVTGGTLEGLASGVRAPGAPNTNPRLIGERFGEWRSAEDWRVDPATGAVRSDDATLQAAFSSGANILIPRIYLVSAAGNLTLTGNLHLRGLGRDLTGIAIKCSAAPTKNGLIFSDATGDTVSMQDMTFRGCWGQPDPNNPGQYLYSETGSALVVLKNIKNVLVDRVAFRDSRAFSFQVRFAENVEVANYNVENSNRDGVAIWDASSVRIHDGYHRGGGDDSISLHVDSDAILPRAQVSVTNIDMVDTNGVSVLGAKFINISNIRGWRLHAQAVGIGGLVTGSQGDTPNFGVNISNVQSWDQMNRSWFVDGQSAAAGAAVLVRALPWRPGAGRAVPPGFADPATGRVVPMVGTLYGNGVLAGNLPNPPMTGLRISGVQARRSLPAVSKYSDWGYGKAFGGKYGPLDYPVTDLSMRGTGMELRGPLWDADISDFDLAAGGYGIRMTYGIDAGGAWADGIFRRVTIRNGRIAEAVNDAITVYGQGTTLTRQDIMIDGVDMSPDSMVASGNRAINASTGKPDGTWGSAVGGPYCINTAYLAGLTVKNNRCRNAAVAVNETGVPAGSNFYEGNLIIGQPAFLNFSASNKGVGQVRAPGPDWWYLIEDSDPTSPTYRQSISAPFKAAASMPSIGTYVAGMFVTAQSAALSGTSGLALGWTRLTTGSLHNAVTAIGVASGGSGGTDGTYPLVFTTVAGSGAAGTATVSGGAVTAVSLTSGGYGYRSGDSVALPAGTGVTGATFSPTFSQDWAQLWGSFGGPNSPYQASGYLAGTNGSDIAVTGSGRLGSYNVGLTPSGTGASFMGGPVAYRSRLFTGAPPSSGSSGNWTSPTQYLPPAGIQIIVVNPGTTMASLTLRLPGNATDGQRLEYRFDNPVSSLAVTPVTGVTANFTLSGVSQASGTSLVFEYTTADKVWRRVL